MSPSKTRLQHSVMLSQILFLYYSSYKPKCYSDVVLSMLRTKAAPTLSAEPKTKVGIAVPNDCSPTQRLTLASVTYVKPPRVG